MDLFLMNIFIEKGMRGGISYISKRYSKTNNEYYSNYDNKKPKTYITYLDMKNLYGHAMSQYLQYANFKWVKNINQIEQKIMKIKSNGSTGYMLEVDLEYPKNFMNIDCLETANEHNINIRSAKKLVTNLMDKDNCVIYYRDLLQFLELGMKF